RLGFRAPSGLPCFEGLPDLLDGQRLDRQGLRSLEVTLAFDGAEGGFLRGVELLPHDFPVERVSVLRRAGGPIRRGPAKVPRQPLYADDLEAARSVRVRVDFDRLPESEPKLAEGEGIEVIAARVQPEGGLRFEGLPRVLPARRDCGKILGPRHGIKE